MVVNGGDDGDFDSSDGGGGGRGDDGGADRVMLMAAVAVMKAAVGLVVPGVEMAEAAEIVLVVKMVPTVAMVVPMTTAYRAVLGTCTLGSGPSHSDTDRVAASLFAGKNTV